MNTQTNTFRENKTMRIGVVMAVIALITLIGLCGTFAKYVSSASGSDTTRVAKWGVNMDGSIDLDLFSDASGEVVDSSNGDNVIAPGMSQSDTITLATFNGDAPEVKYEYACTLGITDSKSSATTDAVNALIKAKQVEFYFTYNGTTYKTNDSQSTGTTLGDFATQINNKTKKTYAPNTKPSGADTEDKITIGWSWTFDTSSGNALDTSTGNAAALDTIGNLTFTLTVGASQLNS